MQVMHAVNSQLIMDAMLSNIDESDFQQKLR